MSSWCEIKILSWTRPGMKSELARSNTYDWAAVIDLTVLADNDDSPAGAHELWRITTFSMSCSESSFCFDLPRS